MILTKSSLFFRYGKINLDFLAYCPYIARMSKSHDIDQSPEARMSTEESGAPVAAVTIMKVVDVTLRFPEASNKQVAEMCGINHHLVPRALSTAMARARIDSAYDIRTIISKNLRNQALNSFLLLQKVQERALQQLEDESKVPDAALLAAATRTSLETLKGVGILKEHSIEETKPIDEAGITSLLDKAEELRSQIEARLAKKIDAEVVVTEDVSEDAQ